MTSEMIFEGEETGARRARRVVPAHAVFPELAPPEALEPAPALEPADEYLRDLDLPETATRTARVTVYALNAVVMVFALPVGLALLVLNLLGGEHLRATAHGLALTGAYMGLASTPEGAALLSALV